MGFRDRLERAVLGDPDVNLLRGIFPSAAVYSHEGWTIADIDAGQLIAFTGHDETTFVEDDGSGSQTWGIGGREITVRKDPDREYRAYLAPEEQ